MSPQLGWYIINVFTILFLVIDIYLFTDEIKGNTWSQIVIEKSRKHIYYPFAWGFLMGHWFG